MINVNITNFRKDIYNLLDNTIKYNEPINISTKNGNAIIISEQDYRNLIATFEVYNNPELKNYNEYLQNLQKINIQNLKENNSSINNKKKEEIEYKPNNYNVNYLNNINNNFN